MFDSGCTNHMTGAKEMLDQFIEDVNRKSSITFGDNSQGKVLGYGKVAITKDLSLENVLLVKSLAITCFPLIILLILVTIPILQSKM